MIAMSIPSVNELSNFVLDGASIPITDFDDFLRAHICGGSSLSSEWRIQVVPVGNNSFVTWNISPTCTPSVLK